MEFFYVVKATQKSGKQDAVIWFTAKSAARANLQLDVALEEAGIEETGRGKDYAKPIRTDFPVVNDLPEEGTVDYTWCDRYQLSDDQRNWNMIPGASSQDETTLSPVTTSDADLPAAPVTATDTANAGSTSLLENRTPAVRFAVHLLGDKYLSEISQEQQIVANELAADEENVYFQSLLQAKNDVPEIAELSLHAEWKLVQAVKDVFPQDKEHEPARLAAFMSSWITAEAGDRNQLVEDWLSGKLPAPELVDTIQPGDDEYISDEDVVQEGSAVEANQVHALVQAFREKDMTELHAVPTLPFRHRLLAQFITEKEYAYHIDNEQLTTVRQLEMDTDNSYVQNLLLAAENVEGMKKLRDFEFWRLTDAVKCVFPADKATPDLSLMLQFMKAWKTTDYIDRGLLTKEWINGNRVSTIQRTDTGTNAGGGIKTDRNADYEHTLDTLDIEIACATLPMDFDIYNIPGSIHRRAKDIVAAKESPWKEWSAALRKTAGILDYSRAAIFALIREASSGITSFPDRMTGYISAALNEYKHEKPEAEILAAARQIDSSAVVAGVIQGTEPVESLKALSTEYAVVGKAAAEAAQSHQHVTTAQPEVANLGGGVFSIEGLLATPSNEVAKQEAEIVGNVQMEESDPSKVEAGDAVSAVENVDATAAQADSVNSADILAAAAPELASNVAADLDQIIEPLNQDEPVLPQTEPETPVIEPEADISEPEAFAQQWPAYFEPGRYEGVPNDVYHAANGISSTQVKDARISLMFYHGRHVAKTIRRESSEALTFGSLAHTLALEPEKLHEEFAVFLGVPKEAFTTTDSMKAFIREFNADKPKAEQLKLTGKKEELQAAIRAVNPDAIFADEFEQQWRDSVAGKTILSSEQLALATAIQQALLNHESAGKLLRHPSRSVETSYFGMDDETGLEVRVRPDLEVEINGVRIGVDLKTISMGRVKQDGLRTRLHREIIDRDYHLSAGMYCAVADFDQFFWIFVNKDESYHWVAVIEASEDLLALGMQEYQKTMRALAQAYDTNCWPAPITEDYTEELNDFDQRRLESLRLA